MPAAWGRVTTEEIAGAVGAEKLTGPSGAMIAGVGTDTRTLRPGELFFALRGERFDGHDFIAAALELGAAGVVCDTKRWDWAFPVEDRTVISVSDTLVALGDLASWWRRNHTASVAVVTGSVGKTTTKEMASGILELEGPTLKSRGNLNNLIGLPLTLFGLKEEHLYAVLEMGMNRPGEIARLTEIAAPQVGLITNVAMAHLEGLGDIRAVAGAKAELLDRMSPEGVAILNGDDAVLMAEASRFQGELITFGLGPSNDFRAERIRDMGREGTAFTLIYDGGRIDVRLTVPGRQNVWNALAASALAVVSGSSSEKSVQGIKSYTGIPGRFALMDLPGGGILVDDTYNANPSSLKAALESLRVMAAGGGRIIVCLGDMLELGREAVAAHLEAGRMAAEYGAAHILVMGEHSAHVIRGAVESGFPADLAKRVRNHEEMADAITGLMEERDMVLLKASRGMRFERVLERLWGTGTKGAPRGLHKKGSGGGQRTGSSPTSL